MAMVRSVSLSPDEVGNLEEESDEEMEFDEDSNEMPVEEKHTL
jgi:hypothetical protein